MLHGNEFVATTTPIPGYNLSSNFNQTNSSIIITIIKLLKLQWVQYIIYTHSTTKLSIMCCEKRPFQRHNYHTQHLSNATPESKQFIFRMLLMLSFQLLQLQSIRSTESCSADSACLPQ